MTNLNYPEHHDVWLSEMGITRWQATKILNHVEPDAVEAESLTVFDSIYDLPHSIVSSRYWVVSRATLDSSDAYLLAGMMKSIGANTDDVIYSYVTTAAQEELLQQATGLPSWSVLKIQTIKEQALSSDLSLPDSLQVFVVGDLTHQWHAKIDSLPSLSDMQKQPSLKRDAWQILKKYCMV